MNDMEVSGEIDTLRALLGSTPRKRQLSPELKRDFRRHMIEQGLQLNRDGVWMTLVAVPVVYVTLYSLVRLLSGPGHMDGNLHVLNWAVAWELFFASTIVIMERLPAIRRLYPVYTVFAWSGLIAVACIATAALPDPYMNALAGYVVSLIILVVFALGVFDIRLSLISAIIGIVTAYVVSHTLGLWFDPGYFVGYAVLPTLVGLVIAHLIEMRDCTSFLQGRLLAAEKLLIDRYAAEVEHLSRRDALTGLANRRHFNEVMEREWHLARRQKREVALLFIDVDYFKAFNDTYGHQEGDHVLSAIGSALARCIKRPADLAARYGGEEFVVLLPDTTVDGAHDVARHIADEVAALAIPHGSSKAAAQVTLSIGVATVIPDDQAGIQVLLAAADAAVYAAKKAGRNRIMLAP